MLIESEGNLGFNKKKLRKLSFILDFVLELKFISLQNVLIALIPFDSVLVTRKKQQLY